jgi:hypothetical protein
MIRICPKCGDYYADALLAFCLVDGTPLTSVAQTSERWNEGARVIEEKENARRKQKRKLKRRRIVLSAMTIMIATMVVYVAVANTLIYLKAKPEGEAAAKPLTEPTAPGGLTASVPPGAPDEPMPTPTPQLTLTPTPTPKATTTQTPTTTHSPTTISTQGKPPECSVADKSLEKRTIVEKFGVGWRRNIEGERRRIIAENMPGGIANAIGQLTGAKPEATLGAIEYESSFPQMCRASITARYVWQVRINLNGRIKAMSIAGQRKFACAKTLETWRCS